MTVHAAPSSVFFGEGAMAWALPRNGSFAALRSHNHCLQLLAAVLPRWASLRGIASDKPEQTRHEHESGKNYERQAPCWLTQSSTSARHRSVRLDVELKVELQYGLLTSARHIQPFSVRVPGLDSNFRENHELAKLHFRTHHSPSLMS